MWFFTFTFTFTYTVFRVSTLSARFILSGKEFLTLSKVLKQKDPLFYLDFSRATTGCNCWIKTDKPSARAFALARCCRLFRCLSYLHRITPFHYCVINRPLWNI